MGCGGSKSAETGNSADPAAKKTDTQGQAAAETTQQSTGSNTEGDFPPQASTKQEVTQTEVMPPSKLEQASQVDLDSVDKRASIDQTILHERKGKRVEIIIRYASDNESVDQDSVAEVFRAQTPYREGTITSTDSLADEGQGEEDTASSKRKVWREKKGAGTKNLEKNEQVGVAVDDIGHEHGADTTPDSTRSETIRSSSKSREEKESSPNRAEAMEDAISSRKKGEDNARKDVSVSDHHQKIERLLSPRKDQCTDDNQIEHFSQRNVKDKQGESSFQNKEVNGIEESSFQNEDKHDKDAVSTQNRDRLEAEESSSRSVDHNGKAGSSSRINGANEIEQSSTQNGSGKNGNDKSLLEIGHKNEKEESSSRNDGINEKVESSLQNETNNREDGNSSQSEDKNEKEEQSSPGNKEEPAKTEGEAPPASDAPAE